MTEDAATTENAGTHLGYAVVRVAQVLVREMERRLAPLALTPTAFSALFQLARDSEMSAAALARTVVLTPQRLGTLLDGLAAAGLVVRERGGVRGAIRTTLTERGRERLAAADRMVRTLDAELAARLPGIDHAHLAAMLHRAADPPLFS